MSIAYPVSQEIFKQLVEVSGGKISGNYVITPGCLIISQTHITVEAANLFEIFNGSPISPGYEKTAEFADNLEGFNFPASKQTGVQFAELGPPIYSPYSFKHCCVGLLVAGISTETVTEISQKTQSQITMINPGSQGMKFPMYRLQGSSDAQEETKQYLSRVIDPPTSKLSTEQQNRLLPTCKATAVMFSMNLCEYNRLFESRQSHSLEFQELRTLMINQLHKIYPCAIRSIGEYNEI